jgi:hypothetical protein
MLSESGQQLLNGRPSPCMPQFTGTSSVFVRHFSCPCQILDGFIDNPILLNRKFQMPFFVRITTFFYQR